MNMVRIHLSPLDLTRTRFAFSPLWEMVMGYRVMRDPSHFAVHLCRGCASPGKRPVTSICPRSRF